MKPPLCSKDVVLGPVRVALSPQPHIKLRAIDADAPPDPDSGQFAGGNELVGLGPADTHQLLDVLQTQPLQMLRITHEPSFGALRFPTIPIILCPSLCREAGTRMNEAELRV